MESSGTRAKASIFAHHSSPRNQSTDSYNRLSPPLSESSEGTMMDSSGHDGCEETFHMMHGKTSSSRRSPLSPSPNPPGDLSMDGNRHADLEGYTSEIEIPIWLPERIKVIVESFLLKQRLTLEQLDSLTQYRGALEINRRHRWNDYIKAADAKQRQRRSVQRFRRVSSLRGYIKYRVALYKLEKEKADEAMRKLTDIQHGVMILDGIVNKAFIRELRKYGRQPATTK